MKDSATPSGASPPPAGSDELNTGLLLFIPYRALERRIFAALRSAGYDDFTVAQAKVFQRIAAEGSRLTDLAEAAQITKQSAGFSVDALEKAGYVERTPDPADARARLVVVAPRGAALVARSAEIVAQIESEWEAHLGTRGWRDLRRLLSRLREITDD
jgi:DNA-binding MarR family transcriptional regulator